MIAAIVVHHGCAEMTGRCLVSLLEASPPPGRILVMDNGGGKPGDGIQLRTRFGANERVSFRGDGSNIGFAAACNIGFYELLDDETVEAVLLVNNDCEVNSDFVARMAGGLKPSERVDMVASRMLVMESPDRTDSLGIVLFSCGIAANRKSEQEPLLGPCGGAALYSTRLLRDLRTRTGQCFEPRFFCYAEDTDLAIRARLLGYHPAFVSEAVALHVGGAASGGGNSPFVMYHGLRNSLSTLARCMPITYFLKHGHKLILLQFMLLAKYLRLRRVGLLMRVWIHVLRELPASLRMRKCLRRSRLLRWEALRDVMDRRFYQTDYLREQVRQLLSRQARKAGT